jgi:hypothetical protein
MGSPLPSEGAEREERVRRQVRAGWIRREGSMNENQADQKSNLFPPFFIFTYTSI